MPPYNAADPKATDKKRDKIREDQGIRDEVLRALMSNPRGRRFVWNELEICRVFQQNLDFGPGGHVKTAFNEGKRMLGLRLLTDITRLAPTDYMRMTTENSGVAIPETENGGRDDDN